MKQRVFLPMLLLLVISSVFSSCKPAQEAVRSATPVKIGKLHTLEDYEAVSVSGTIASPEAPANVSFLVSGKVIRVGPREGEYVKKGQLLASIDPTDYQLGLQAATAQVDMARATLDKARNSVRPEQLEQSRIAFERAADEYRRMKMLYESKSLAPNEYQKFKSAFEAAEQQYELAKSGGQKEDKALTQAAFDQAEVNEKMAGKRLADATLYAPVNGFIARRAIEPGETASPGRPIFEIVQLDPVEVSVGVPETDVHLVRIGQQATITLPALPGKSFEGAVRLINVSADAGTRTFMTRIGIPNPEHTLRIGMVAEARIRGDRVAKVFTLPMEAIVRDPKGATMVFVYFPDQQRVYAKRVEVGAIYGQQIEIRSGLVGDEAIVSAGQERLRDGALVSVTPREAPERGISQ